MKNQTASNIVGNDKPANRFPPIAVKFVIYLHEINRQSEYFRIYNMESRMNANRKLFLLKLNIWKIRMLHTAHTWPQKYIIYFWPITLGSLGTNIRWAKEKGKYTSIIRPDIHKLKIFTDTNNNIQKLFYMVWNRKNFLLCIFILFFEHISVKPCLVTVSIIFCPTGRTKIGIFEKIKLCKNLFAKCETSQKAFFNFTVLFYSHPVYWSRTHAFFCAAK